VNLFSAICSLCLFIFSNSTTHSIPQRNERMVPISVSVTQPAEINSTTVSFNTVKRTATFKSKIPVRVCTSSILNLFTSFLNAGQPEYRSFTVKQKRAGGALQIFNNIGWDYWATYHPGKRYAVSEGFITLHFLHLFPDHNFW